MRLSAIRISMNWLEKGYEERFNPASCCARASILCVLTSGCKTCCTESVSRDEVKGGTNVELFCTKRFAAAAASALCK